MRIIWPITFACNLKCEYCYEIRLPDKFKPRAWTDWSHLLKDFESSEIDITGGEPFIHPHFIKLVNSIPLRHQLAITTNLTYPVEWLLAIKRPLFSVTCSLHLTNNHTIEDFEKKLIILKENRIICNITVNFVTHPQQLNWAEKLKARFESLGFYFHLEPFISYEKVSKQIQPEKNVHDNLFLNKNPEIRHCHAGLKSFYWLPNGDVWTCSTAFHHNLLIDPIAGYFLGNLFDGTYKPLQKSIVCKIPCVRACDIDNSKRITGNE